MTRNYVTTAGPAQLPRLRVLHASMRRHCQPFRLHVLAEGIEVALWADEQLETSCEPLGDFLRRHPSLTADRLPGPPRRPSELAWCWRWWFALDILRSQGAVTVLDCDLMYWSSPEPVFEEIGEAGAALLPHAFPPASASLPGARQESHGQWGVFNAGFSYWADPEPLERMAELCRQWSWAKHRPTRDGRRVTYGEQGNMEWVLEEFGERVHVIRHPGAAPGPWCVHGHALTQRPDGGLDFGGRPLIAYHYSSLRPGQLADAPYEISPRQAELLYRPYLDALAAAK